MAKIKEKSRRKYKAARKTLPFGKKNYYIFAVGIFIIILGYFALAQGPADSYFSLSVAPVLLVLGYCVIIPTAILYRGGKTEQGTGGPRSGD